MKEKKKITEKDLDLVNGGVKVGHDSPYDNNFFLLYSIEDSRALNNTLYVFCGNGVPKVCLCCGQEISSFGIPYENGLLYDCFSNEHSILVEE